MKYLLNFSELINIRITFLLDELTKLSYLCVIIYLFLFYLFNYFNFNEYCYYSEMIILLSGSVNNSNPNYYIKIIL